MTSQIETATKLFLKTRALSEKTSNYARNLAWVDATRRDGALAVFGGWKLADKRAEVEAAGKAFAAACVGLTTEQIVEAITAAGA